MLMIPNEINVSAKNAAKWPADPGTVTAKLTVETLTQSPNKNQATFIPKIAPVN